MDFLSANGLAAGAIAILAVAAIVVAIARGHAGKDARITASHQPGIITLTSSLDATVVAVLNDGDSLAESLQRDPLNLPITLAAEEPFSIRYQSDLGRAPRSVLLRLQDGAIRQIDLPSV
ncbi:hypothetical protein I2485_12780 [Nesterenkonia sp. E16_7]|uniref:hypothetical protein n=1 Tax=unclassified Nesterenkonia TaxID=2629769 RepID=UPI001A918A3D|nr:MULTISPECIES: hypothetical protein [unclassified Nesterenkonia]MBO0595885.1 hypothetical protein [Nesterenkonia sp. E16_10]MBO0599516.1 hypothetical protein [Nesterenkonia sp. E16_7]